jgi:hypothetical protein
MPGKYESYERTRKVRLPTPDWWTAIFSGILAVTAVGALWYARDQIKETREESEVQIKESRQQAQIQHLITLVNEFDQEPMATYRRGLAQKRLSNKDSDPDEFYRVLDFFETVGLLVNRGYLNENDVWEEFGYWTLSINADSKLRSDLEDERKDDPTAYANYQNLVERMVRIEAARHGTASHMSQEEVKDFYRDELRIVGGTPIRTHVRSPKQRR